MNDITLNLRDIQRIRGDDSKFVLQELELFLLVANAGDAIHLPDLHRKQGGTKASVYRNLARLEDRKLIETIADPSDSRMKLARLSRKGRDILKRDT